jgi:hypothetical protein
MSSPRFCLEYTFSPTTIASSTRMPRTTMKPNSEMPSIESPSALIAAIAREPQPEEQREQEQDHQEALASAREQRVEAIAQLHRVVAPDGQDGTIGQARCGVVEIAPQLRRDLDDVLLPGTEHPDDRRGLPVESELLVRVLEAVDDARDVAQMHARAVARREDHELLEVHPVIGLALRAQQDLAAVRLDRAARQVEGGHANRVGDLLERQSVALQ